MKLDYSTSDPDIRTLTVTGTAGSISASDVAGIKTKAAVIGSSLRGEVGFDVIEVLEAKKVLLAVDMQGFVRVLRGKELKYEPWEEMRSTLAHVDIVKSDAVEAEFLTGETNIFKAAKFYADMGLKEIVLTHRDGLLIYANDKYHEMGFFSAKLDGRSGRGETCIGTYVTKRLSKPPRESGIWAAAVTSLKMENLGPFNRSISDFSVGTE